MSPELTALVEKVARAIHVARHTRVGCEVQPMDKSDEDYCQFLALAAIRAVAEATREATPQMHSAASLRPLNSEGHYSEWSAWRVMHAASVLGEALRDEKAI